METIPQTKTCCTCKNAKPISDYHRNKTTTDGLTRRCKTCAREAAKQQRQRENPETAKEYKRRWYLDNKADHNAKSKHWRNTHQEQVKAHNKVKYQRDRDAIRRRANGWYWNNTDRARAYRRQYSKSNPEKRYEHHALRRARIKGATQTEKIDRAAIIKRDSATCYLCDRRLRRWQITLDHVMPLVRGGAHTNDNLRVACHSCNSRKGSKLLCEL